MFSSNVGFRRRTVSDGCNQLLPSSSSKHGSSGTQRLSPDESSSTTVKRIVLRKHKNDRESGHRGLADRIAQCEVENIDGFWSGRLSGQRRSLSSNLKYRKANLAEWRLQLRGKDEAPLNVAERSQTGGRPRGHRPLSKAQVTSPVLDSSRQSPSGHGYLPSGRSSGKVIHLFPVSTESDLRTKTSIPALSLTKSNNDKPAADLGLDLRLSYRPLLPPGRTYQQKFPDKTAPEKCSPEKEKKKRFAHLEITLSKLVANKKPASNGKQPPSVAAPNDKQSTALLPPSLPRILPTPISIPFIPIPPIPDFEPIYCPGSRPKSIRSVRSARSSKSGRSACRKLSRKRKTGLARIVVELAKGEKVVAVDAEAIQEAAEVGDILAQLRKMKAS